MPFTRTRVRNQNFCLPHGETWRTHPDGTIYDRQVSVAPLSTTTTTDVVGNPRGQNPFNSYTFWHYSMPKYSQSVGSVKARNAFVPVQSHKDAHAFAPITGRFRDPTDGIANSHPGSPAVSLPNFIYELREAPYLFRDAIRRARNLANSAGGDRTRDVLNYLKNPRKPAEDYLNYKFGWAPMVGDIQNLLQIQEWLDKRMKNFKQYQRYGGLVTRGELGELESKHNGRSDQGSFSFFFHRHYTQKRWFSARWKVDSPREFEQPLLGHQELWSQSLGLDFRLSTVWNSLPWTWLGDWFGNVGSLLTLDENQCGVKFDSAVICTHTKSSEKATVVRAPVGTSAHGTLHRVKETRNRVIFSPNLLKPNLGLDYLGPGQLTTLSALNVVRNGRVARTF